MDRAVRGRYPQHLLTVQSPLGSMVDVVVASLLGTEPWIAEIRSGAPVALGMVIVRVDAMLRAHSACWQPLPYRHHTATSLSIVKPKLLLHNMPIPKEFSVIPGQRLLLLPPLSWRPRVLQPSSLVLQRKPSCCALNYKAWRRFS